MSDSEGDDDMYSFSDAEDGTTRSPAVSMTDVTAKEGNESIDHSSNTTSSSSDTWILGRFCDSLFPHRPLSSMSSPACSESDDNFDSEFEKYLKKFDIPGGYKELEKARVTLKIVGRLVKINDNYVLSKEFTDDCKLVNFDPDEISEIVHQHIREPSVNSLIAKYLLTGDVFDSNFKYWVRQIVTDSPLVFGSVANAKAFFEKGLADANSSTRDFEVIRRFVSYVCFLGSNESIKELSSLIDSFIKACNASIPSEQYFLACVTLARLIIECPSILIDHTPHLIPAFIECFIMHTNDHTEECHMFDPKEDAGVLDYLRGVICSLGESASNILGQVIDSLLTSGDGIKRYYGVSAIAIVEFGRTGRRFIWGCEIKGWNTRSTDGARMARKFPVIPKILDRDENLVRIKQLLDDPIQKIRCTAFDALLWGVPGNENFDSWKQWEPIIPLIIKAIKDDADDAEHCAVCVLWHIVEKCPKALLARHMHSIVDTVEENFNKSHLRVNMKRNIEYLNGLAGALEEVANERFLDFTEANLILKKRIIEIKSKLDQTYDQLKMSTDEDEQ